MSTVVHSTFVIERSYAASPAEVFAAWANPEAKKRWLVGADSAEGQSLEYGLDFRVGGREHSHGNETVYLDIVPDARIIFAYTMSMDGRRISTSLATVELTPDGKGTKLTFTEQGAFLDGLDLAEGRQSGWGSLLTHLGKVLAG